MGLEATPRDSKDINIPSMMKYYRVMQADVGCLCKNLSHEEAFEYLQQFEASGKENCTIEEYEWLDSKYYHLLGRDPDLH